jgi:ATP-dependent RNA helicase DDX18/HAS1
MFLLPSEVGFLKLLKEARVPLVEFELPAKKILSKLSLLNPESSQLT